MEIYGTDLIVQAPWPSDVYIREGEKVQLHSNGTFRRLGASNGSTEEQPEDEEHYDLTQAERNNSDSEIEMPGLVSSEDDMPALVSCDDDSSDKTPAPVNRRGQRTAWICTNCGS